MTASQQLSQHLRQHGLSLGHHAGSAVWHSAWPNGESLCLVQARRLHLDACGFVIADVAMRCGRAYMTHHMLPYQICMPSHPDGAFPQVVRSARPWALTQQLR
jgi:hypothetical protein